MAGRKRTVPTPAEGMGTVPVARRWTAKMHPMPLTFTIGDVSARVPNWIGD